MRPDPNKAFPNPAIPSLCYIKKRFDDELTDYLLEIKWWDWPIEKIEANFKALSSGDLSLIRCISG